MNRYVFRQRNFVTRISQLHGGVILSHTAGLAVHGATKSDEEALRVH